MESKGAPDIEKLISSLSFERSPFEGQENIVIVTRAGEKDFYKRDRITVEEAMAALKYLQDTNQDRTVRMGFSISTPKLKGAGTDALMFSIE